MRRWIKASAHAGSGESSGATVDPSARLVQGVPLEGPPPTLLGYEPVSDRVIGGVREIEYRPQGESSWGQTLSDIASRTQGAFAGALSSFANMVIGTGQIALNSALQVGDLQTLGYNHDHPLIQQAWSEQQQLDQGASSIVAADSEPGSGNKKPRADRAGF